MAGKYVKYEGCKLAETHWNKELPRLLGIFECSGRILQNLSDLGLPLLPAITIVVITCRRASKWSKEIELQRAGVSWCRRALGIEEVAEAFFVRSGSNHGTEDGPSRCSADDAREKSIFHQSLYNSNMIEPKGRTTTEQQRRSTVRMPGLVKEGESLQWGRDD